MTKILVDKMPVKAEECPFSAYYSKTCDANYCYFFHSCLKAKMEKFKKENEK